MLKATNIKQCLAIDVPAFVAFYRAAAGFSGADEFELEIAFASGHKQIQRFFSERCRRGQRRQGKRPGYLNRSRRTAARGNFALCKTAC
ncbi:MAG: hypothetical protein WB868_03255 [Xanthobacteraceae bacterium]